MFIDEAVRILDGADLDAGRMEAVMEEIMTGTAATEQIVGFLNALKARGETVEEVSAAARVMRRHARMITSKHSGILDTCGTGGDGKHTFNISTAAAFVASGAGIAVAKHGNRAVSGISGSADVLKALGVDIELAPEAAGRCLDETGIVFLFAPVFHPAMKYAMPARKRIGARTIFNVLGPLINPAGATHQLIGVFDEHWASIIAGVLAPTTSHALVVHGKDGLDEVSLSGPTIIFEVAQGEVSRFELSPGDAGFFERGLREVAGGGAEENARTLTAVLKGARGPVRDIVVLNAAAAIYAAGPAANEPAAGIRAAVAAAVEAIDSGKALRQLQRLRDFSPSGKK